jgi:hypothetical protein
MSKVIKKHRWQMAGIALPAFFLFLLWAVGVSVYPGWVRPLYGVVGAPCDASNPGTACDLCVGEQCEFNSTNPGPGFFCQADSGSFATPDPVAQCPQGVNGSGDPDCHRNCVEDTTTSIDCLPDDTFCEEISGGTEPNDCRVAICLDPLTPDPLNPTGCDYASDLGAGPDCVLCATPAPTGTPSSCGNGVCEPIVAGENPTNCSIDCRVPGFTGPILSEGDPILDNACFDLSGITFDGPPFNEPNQGSCEDGDVCTDNTCAANGGPPCTVTPKSCSGDLSDLCCARSCTPPPTGEPCANILDCDVDCYVATECTLPTPSPTPTPPPPGNPLIEGSGCSLSALAGSSSALAWLAGLGLIGGFGFLRRRR